MRMIASTVGRSTVPRSNWRRRIPDYLPGGLRDDEQVAAWVLRRVDPTIRDYEAWEASIGESTADLNAKQNADAKTYMVAAKTIPDSTPAEAKANLAANSPTTRSASFSQTFYGLKTLARTTTRR